MYIRLSFYRLFTLPSLQKPCCYLMPGHFYCRSTLLVQLSFLMCSLLWLRSDLRSGEITESLLPFRDLASVFFSFFIGRLHEAAVSVSNNECASVSKNISISGSLDVSVGMLPSETHCTHANYLPNLSLLLCLFSSSPRSLLLSSSSASSGSFLHLYIHSSRAELILDLLEWVWGWRGVGAVGGFPVRFPMLC